MQNADHYPEPLQFNGFRFADPQLLHDDAANLPNFEFLQPEGPSKLTDPSSSWHVFGTGRLVWYVPLASASPAPSFPYNWISLTFSRRLTVILVRTNSPGRFYAAAVIKIMLAQVILNYDCELVDKNARRWFTWRSSTLPKEKAMVIFHPRRLREKRQQPIYGTYLSSKTMVSHIALARLRPIIFIIWLCLVFIE